MYYEIDLDLDNMPEDWDDILDKFLGTTDKLDITGWEEEHENYISTQDLICYWGAVIRKNSK